MRQSLYWETFLLSPAISYPSRNIPSNVYWSSNLLQKWQTIYTHHNEATKENFSTINYGSLLLLACYTSKVLHERILATKKKCNNSAQTTRQDARIGLAITEGPFLPLFVLTIHSLNVSKTLFRGNSSEEETSGHNAVILIPMETDEAPERLRHILLDSDPDMILASRKGMDDLLRVLDDNSSMELIDYTVIVEEALQLIVKERSSRHAIERLFPDRIQEVMIDSLRYEHAIPGAWDVARLVAWGFILLDTDIQSQEVDDIVSSINKTTDALRGDRSVVSHIVYTSGTTGEYLLQFMAND